MDSGRERKEGRSNGNDGPTFRFRTKGDRLELEVRGFIGRPDHEGRMIVSSGNLASAISQRSQPFPFHRHPKRPACRMGYLGGEVELRSVGSVGKKRNATQSDGIWGRPIVPGAGLPAVAVHHTNGAGTAGTRRLAAPPQTERAMRCGEEMVREFAGDVLHAYSRSAKGCSPAFLPVGSAAASPGPSPGRLSGP